MEAAQLLAQRSEEGPCSPESSPKQSWLGRRKGQGPSSGAEPSRKTGLCAGGRHEEKGEKSLAWDQKGRGGALAGMAAGPLGSKDLLNAWDRLVWGLTCRALRTCQGGNVRVLQLMLKPWCISRAVYQVGPETPLLFLCSMRNSWGMVGKGRQLLSFLHHV